MANYDGYGDDHREGGFREDKPLDYDVVSSVKDFVYDLHQTMRRSHIMEELETLYTITYRKLGDEYYKNEPWPAAEIIANQCNNDEAFLYFYRELRLRHINVTQKVTIHDRFEAWTNYCRLFDMLLDCGDTDFIVTGTWAFDIINEFVYQFQSFCQFRTQLDARTDVERELLRSNQDYWAVQNVYSYLHGLIRVSNIVPLLESKKVSQVNAGAAPKAPSQLHQMLGYFALIGMSRLNCLLADYYECLNVLGPLDVNDKSEIFAGNLLAYSSLFYHMGLSFIMLRRYRDAGRTFSEIMVQINRSLKTGQLQKADADQLSKAFDKMVSLLTIATFLAPGQTIDDSIMQMIVENNREHLSRMAEGEEPAFNSFRELFTFSCPKFIVASVPDYHINANTSTQLLNQQIHQFCVEMRQQLSFPKVRSYLKLYTTISITKVASFNNIDTDTLLATLVSMKHKMNQIECNATGDCAPLDGKHDMALPFNYYVEDETIVIDEHAQEQRFERYFLSQISKCDTVAQLVDSIHI